MSKILITGSAGLIGREVSARLLEYGHDVVDCDIRFKDNPLSFFSNEIQPILEECDGIIHLAAISRVIHGEQYPDLCEKVNVRGTIKLLEFYKNLPNKPWFIYGSSREVYGEQNVLPVSENVDYNPVNQYAEGKVIIEKRLNALKRLGFSTAILRFSNVYGGMLDHYDRVVPAFCINALKNAPIKIEGKQCVFDFTYIDDVVDGILLAVDKINTMRNIDSAIHFTTGRGCDLKELAKIILEISKSSSTLDYHPPRIFDVNRFYGDFSNAEKLLGWKPIYSLEEGIDDFIQNLKSTKNNCPNNIEMVIYEDIKSYSWLPSLL